MAVLTQKQRDALPASKFAGPNESFPIPDKKHAKAAIMLSGKAPPADRAHIIAVAQAMLRSGAK